MIIKYSLSISLLVIPVLAFGQWVKVDVAESVVIYADPASRQAHNNVVKMWELINYASPRPFAGLSFQSSKVLREFDCQKREMRTLAFTIFKWPMGEGDVIHSHRVENSIWQLVEPYSVGESSWKLACSGKLQ